MPIFIIEKDNATLAVVEAGSSKGAIVEHATSEGLTARVATKQDLFEYMRAGGVVGPAKDADTETLPLPEAAPPTA